MGNMALFSLSHTCPCFVDAHVHVYRDCWIAHSVLYVYIDPKI